MMAGLQQCNSRRGAAITLSGKTAVAGYTHDEVEELLAQGNPGGKLTKHDLATPALILDLDLFESNLQKMAAFVRSRGRGFRPHAKTHKCPEIARRQIAAGASGVAVAKISEAEVFAKEGIGGLLVTTAVVGPRKIARAVRLAATWPETTFVVDNEINTRELSEAAQAEGIRIKVALDLYVGRRTGVLPGRPALELARQVAAMRGLELEGIQAYAGHASHVIGFDERRRFSRECMSQAVETRHVLEQAGIEVRMLAGGSTGTYNIFFNLNATTELQPGSFIFMDVDYGRIGGPGSDAFTDFAKALTVLATVISRPEPYKAIVDAGLKAFSTDKPFPPESKNLPGLLYGFAGDEHGRLDFSSAACELKVGDRLEFVIPHCDPTVNLYDRLYCVRGEKVEEVWKISARGMSQ